MSKVIAVAGGTGGIGRHIVDGLVNAKKQVIILSRTPQPEFEKRGVTVRVVDYDSVDSLKTGLTGVDTVISTAFALQGFLEGQTKLVQACVDVGVKRFIPSEWALDLEKYPDGLKIIYHPKIALREVLAKSPLEYTLVCNGLFMDYFLPKGAKKYLKDVPLPVDVENATAGIPGTGNEKVAYTLGDDIGAAVAALMDFPKWDRYTFIHGDSVTFNQIVEIGERVTGKKFAVTYIPKDAIQKQIDEAKDPLSRFYAEVYMGYATGEGELSKSTHFPGVKFTRVEELIQKTYGK